MDSFQTVFHDIPQINIDKDGPLHQFEEWTNYNDSDLVYSVSASRFTYGNVSRPNYPPIDTQSMSTMDRFLHGPEQPPFMPDCLSGGFRRTNTVYRPMQQQYGYNIPYEAQFPDVYGRQPSPVSSGSQSSVHSWGPWHSDDTQSSPRLPAHSPRDFCVAPDGALYSGVSVELPPAERHCSMAEVQLFQDETPVAEFDTEIKLEHEHIFVRGQGKGEEDWQDHESIPDPDSPQAYTSSHEDAEEGEDPDYKPNGKIVTKRKQLKHLQNGSSPQKSSGRRLSHSRKPPTISLARPVNASKVRKPSRRPSKDEVRHFPCPLAEYGCGSTFTSKNEWKRHVNTQHLRPGFWRCDLCPETANASPNDFNRKDLFTQHLRRMHSKRTYQNGEMQKEEISDELITVHQDRCYQRVRGPPPKSGCLFCNVSFQGPGSWDERMEHVGRHLEQDRKAGGKGVTSPGNWREDNVLRDWLYQEGLIESNGNGGWKMGDGVPKRGQQEA